MAEPISKDTAEHYNWGEGCDGWHFLKSDDVSIIRERVPPGAAEVCHLHRYAQQFFFVLSGMASLWIGEEYHVLHEGQGCHVPKGTPHQLSNKGQDALEFLVVSAPMAHGDRVVLSGYSGSE